MEAEEEAETVAWGCRQEPQGLPAYVMVSAIRPSDVSGEPSRQQAVQPQSSNSNRLRLRQHQVEAEEEDCC